MHRIGGKRAYRNSTSFQNVVQTVKKFSDVLNVSRS